MIEFSRRPQGDAREQRAGWPMRSSLGALFLLLAMAGCKKEKEDLPVPAMSTTAESKPVDAAILSTASASVQAYRCPKIEACCTTAPDSAHVAGVDYFCSGMKTEKLKAGLSTAPAGGGYARSCDENVALLLKLYADAEINTAKVKPPAGCAK
jgi:hypothetical protein